MDARKCRRRFFACARATKKRTPQIAIYCMAIESDTKESEGVCARAEIEMARKLGPRDSAGRILLFAKQFIASLRAVACALGITS